MFSSSFSPEVNYDVCMAPTSVGYNAVGTATKDSTNLSVMSQWPLLLDYYLYVMNTLFLDRVGKVTF